MKPILLDIPDTITTPRLILRAPKVGDGSEVNAAVQESFEELHFWMPWARNRPSVEETEENLRHACAKWILRSELRILIFDRASGRLAGSSGFHGIDWDLPSFEIGYWVRSSFAGKGYIQESTNALTRFAFSELRARRVEIRCDALNVRSVKVCEQLGYDLEGRLRNHDTHTHSSEPRDTLIYGRISADKLPALDVKW